MNENNNRVNTTLTDAALTEITTLLQQVEQKLAPIFVGLSPEQRTALPKINVENKAFVEDAINNMRHPVAQQIMPAFLKPADAETDLKLFNQMEQIQSRLENLAAQVDSLRLLAGSEAYTSALSFKRLADAAELAGIIGADAIAAKLRERFKGQGPRGGATITPSPGEGS